MFDLGTLIKPQNNQLCDFMTIETGRLARIPGCFKPLYKNGGSGLDRFM